MVQQNTQRLTNISLFKKTFHVQGTSIANLQSLEYLNSIISNKNQNSIKIKNKKPYKKRNVLRFLRVAFLKKIVLTLAVVVIKYDFLINTIADDLL